MVARRLGRVPDLVLVVVVKPPDLARQHFDRLEAAAEQAAIAGDAQMKAVVMVVVGAIVLVRQNVTARLEPGNQDATDLLGL